ncbi:hypothetical protein F383_36699 [Gossypium arboreum]
MYQNH